MKLDTVSACDVVIDANAAKKIFTVALNDCGPDAKRVDNTSTGKANSEIADTLMNSETGDNTASGVGLHFYRVNETTDFLMKSDGTEEGTSLQLNPGADNKLNLKAA